MSDPLTLGAPPPAGSGIADASLRVLLAQAGEVYWETDAGLRFSAVHAAPAGGGTAPPALASWLALWPGKHPWDVGAPGEAADAAQALRQALGAHEPFADLALLHQAPGQVALRIALYGAPVFRADGVFAGYVGIGRDVSELHRARATLRQLATIDPLTHLPNREAFEEHAQQALAQAYARGRPGALLCIGLDRFEVLNSVYGHRVGDRLLTAVGARLALAVQAPDLLGRRSADEIAALLVDVPGADEATARARTLIAAVSAPERLDNVAVALQASVGVALFPRDGGDLDELLNAGEAALQRARQAGGGVEACFTKDLARRTDLRLRLEQRLRRAYESRDFRLVYQPLVNLPEGNLVGAEALLRWNDAELGDIQPGEFIPIAEQSGLIEGLGEWVLREACRQRQMWRQVGLQLPPVAVNVSGVQLRNRDFVDRVLQTLEEFDVAADDLEIEITETGLMECTDSARRILARLRDAGIRAALDDFGVGYSSLAHLRDLPMHRLKIDRSFTVECMRDARTLTIVKSVVEMAHNLGLTVTAEGIETAEQRNWMHQLGCDSAQGFHFARPMAADDFLKRFLDGRALDRAAPGARASRTGS